MKFPEHKCGLYLEHNVNRDNYQTVKQWLEDGRDEPPFQSDEHRKRAIETNEIWILHWYPDTPVGFCEVAAPTLEDLLAFANGDPGAFV